MQNFSHLYKGNISNSGLNGGVGKMCIFQQKTDHISETVRDTAKVAINH